MWREQFMSLFDFDSDYFYWKVLVVAIIILKLISNRQTSPLNFYYNKRDRLMCQFLEQTKVTKFVYRPYWLAVTPFLQSLTYITVDELQKYWFPKKFDRELITLEDGGTVGIDWAIDKDTGEGRPNPRAQKRKPILLLAPGLGGSSNNLYTIGLMHAARKSGYKVGTLLFRGTNGIPITSDKISFSGAWTDIKELIEYVHQKYVLADGNAGRRCRLYAYGCSLGAQILTLYLRKEGRKACEVLDGACVYGTPWSTSKGSEFFYNNAFGLYQKVIGLSLSEIIRKEQLPQLKEYLSEEDYAYYKHALENNWSGLDVLDEHLYCKMFGFASKQEYYDAVSIAEHVTDIKVPTFALDAKDDQLCGTEFFAPTKAVQGQESKVMLATTDFGAHVCHMQGHLIPKPWYTPVIMEWLQFMEAQNTFKKK